MFVKLKKLFELFERSTRLEFIFFTFSRSILGVLDLFGILLIGLLLSNLAGGYINEPSNYSANKSFLSLPLLKSLDISQLTLLALFVFLVKSVAANLIMKFMTNKFSNLESKISSKIFENILNSKLDKISQLSKSEYTYSLTIAAGYGITYLLTALVIIASELFLLLLVISIFAFVNLEITLFVAIYFLCLGAIINNNVGKKMQDAGTEYSRANLLSISIIENSISAFREIYTQNKQKVFLENFSKARLSFAKSIASINYLGGLPRYVIEAALMLGTVALVFFSLATQDFETAAGTLGVFLTGALRVVASMLPLQNSIGNLKQFLAQSERFISLANEFDSNPLTESFRSKKVVTRIIPDSGTTVEFKSVTYSYLNSNVLAVNNVSLKINSGEYVALIGPSGAGKSTLADLIMGLITPNDGKIEIGAGKNFNLGYVPQSPGIISGSILENITLTPGSLDFDNKKLEYALKLANLDSLINSMPDGVFTNIGAQLDSLSGGQLQRIGLARALYMEPSLLLLDEATSALDAETESAVTDSLDALKGLCTIIVIAHRLTTVKNADRVFVVEDGKISTSGKFSELTKSSEIVSRYVELSEINFED